VNKWQRDVRNFHRKLGYAAPESLTLATPEVLYLRRRLVAEEARELLEALGDGDPANIAGECVDLLYVVLGTAVSLGIDLGPHWQAVHGANMGKEAGPRGSKARKPAGWKGADHSEILCAQVSRRWWQFWK